MYDTKRTRRALAKAPSATGGSVGHQAAAAPSSMRAPAFASARGAPAQDAALLDALELAYTPRFDVANGCLHALAVEPVSRAETGGVGGDAAPCPRGSEHPSLRGVPPEAWLGAIFEHLAADLARSPELRAAPRLSLELPGPLALHPSVRSHVDALRATLRLTGGDGAGAELLEWVLPAELATPTPRASAPQAAAQTRPSGADGVPDASVAELICWALAARVGIALRFSDDPTLDQLLRVARTFDRARIHVHVRQLGRGDADGADDLFAECFAHLVRRARMELTVEGIRTAREAERSHRLGAHALGGPLFGEALAAAELPRVSLDTCPWHPKDPPI